MPMETATMYAYSRCERTSAEQATIAGRWPWRLVMTRVVVAIAMNERCCAHSCVYVP